MIRQTCDMDLVNPILQHPKIWPDISDNDDPFDTPYLSGHLYFLVNWTHGVIIFDPFLDGWLIHPNILPEYRGKSAFKAIDEAIRAVFDMGYRRVYAEIDAELRHVTWCARRLGFKLVEETDRQLFVRTHLDG